MARQQGSSLASAQAIGDTTVVDADVHLSSSAIAGDAARYADSDPIRTRLASGSPPWPRDNWDRRIGGKIERHRITDLAELHDICDAVGIDHPVVNTFAPVGRIGQPALATGVARAYNDLLVAEFLDPDPAVYGLASVATQEPDKAAEELDRLGDEDQVVGAFFTTQGPTPPLGDPTYDVIYRAAEDNDLAVVYHGSAPTEYDYPMQDYRQFLSVHTLAHLFQQAQTLTSVLVNGLPEKFPGLEYVFLEAGLGWVPYLTFRLNKEYSIRRSEAPLLERQPETYVRESFHFGTQPLEEPLDTENLAHLFAMLDPESILFATDVPHWDFDHPSALDRTISQHFDDADREKILHANATDVFGLDV